MHVKNTRGLLAAAAPVAIAAVLLGACGGSDASSTSLTTINLGSTAFVTRPPETTTTTIAGTIDDAVVAGEQEYEVQAGDFPLRVADLFGISVEDIGTYNGWAACSSLSCPEFPGPGSIIRIPPGANNIEVATPQPDVDPDVEIVTGGETEQPPGDTIPEAGDNCAAGSYTIEDGDFEGRVAEKFDVTVDALRAANANNPEYSIFYPGLQIVIPAKADC